MHGLSFLLLEHSKGQGCEQHSAMFPASGLTGPGWAVVHGVSTGLGPANDFFGHVLITLAAVVGTAAVPGTTGSAAVCVVAQGAEDERSRRTRPGEPARSQPLIACCLLARADGVTKPPRGRGPP